MGLNMSDATESKNDTDEKEGLVDLLIHDLAGPLSVVTTSAANLLQKAERYGPLTEGQKRVLQRVLRNARKAQTLLHEMVEVHRSQEGVFQSDFFLVRQILEDALLDVLDFTSPEATENILAGKSQEEFLKALENYGISFEIVEKYRTCPFCHDQRKISQVFRNLMSNALKYRRAKMRVCISGESELCVSVEDDGRGIPQKDHQLVFERFVRLVDQNDSTIQGLGLGLTGVKALVEAMGGEITLESEEKVGTRFKVRIPPLEPPGFHSRGKVLKKKSILDGRRILAVDDEPDLLSVLEEEILEACPSCQFDKATNFEKAHEMLQRTAYDLVILDIMGVRGFDLLHHAASRNFPVAMLTAHALSPEALKRSMELGARAYLPKEKLGEIVPFLEDVLLHEYLPGWKRLLMKLDDFFNGHWGAHWRNSESDFWRDFEKKTRDLK
jgi:CheY-like chemotaxis protein